MAMTWSKEDKRGAGEAVKAAGFVGIGVASAFLGILAHKVFIRRVRNVDMITASMIDKQARVRGLVTRVGDGDNFRLYHTPLLSFTQRRAILGRKMTANDTIHVRLAGVDAPETAHFGKPAQPYANEALEWLRKTITGEKVSVKLLRKDRYGRVVGNAQLLAKWYRPWRKNVSMELTKAGYGSIYAQDDAEYDGMLDRLRKVESDARRKKRGMWKQKKVELPADYKSKYRG
ncbi:putative endonuclease LCL3 [Wallemia ichthyophaga EXF-994]|uniref:Putative endonuclease LCL3 n=1 Tax=Wallemia ichthyophaga (strain EXF-994 / CBS 113033) TaxID=1299270 RepID=R9AXX4_WALI9|nr:putative endonuclease LCL3 [Wallemia ichthyophaga EXF-994]EOR04961.1 putative endonuclease LCL3 [Wallemia ichthyophaga EXF-994]